MEQAPRLQVKMSVEIVMRLGQTQDRSLSLHPWFLMDWEMQVFC
jgi:hypothetical protein